MRNMTLGSTKNKNQNQKQNYIIKSNIKIKKKGSFNAYL